MESAQQLIAGLLSVLFFVCAAKAFFYHPKLVDWVIKGKCRKFNQFCDVNGTAEKFASAYSQPRNAAINCFFIIYSPRGALCVCDNTDIWVSSVRMR